MKTAFPVFIMIMFATLLGCKPTPESYITKGLEKDAQNDHKGAIEAYTMAIKLKPDYAYAYFYRGLEQSEINNYKAAIEDCTMAIKCNPKFSEAYMDRGVFNNMLGDHNSAMAYFTEAIRINPKNDIAYINRGYLKQDLNDNSADLDLAMAVKLNPKNKNNLARVQFEGIEYEVKKQKTK